MPSMLNESGAGIFKAAIDLFNPPVLANATVNAFFPLGLWPTIGIGLILSLIILFCVVGNFFVILAILLERDLRSRPQYYLIFSLAVADLMVGLIVTPIGAWFTLKQAWDLGETLCDFWISVDVLVCTSSILHLVAIALDRYWSITDIYYVQNRTPKRIFFMLMIIWVLSLLISMAPIFGWKDDGFVDRVRRQHVCLISQAISYQVFSTSTAFYIPLCAIIVVYYKIMRAAKKRFRRERDRKTINRTILEESAKSKVVAATPEKHPISPVACTHLLPTTQVQEISCCNSPAVQNGHFKTKMKFESTGALYVSTSDEEKSPMQLTMVEPSTVNPMAVETQFVAKPSKERRFSAAAAKRLAIARTPMGKRKKRGVKETIETRRERKAWRTLAIITGSFVACWTPFFLISLYRPLCHCDIPPVLEFVFNWLGYLNSALNPVIYTVFSMDFRMAFERILKRMCLIKK